MIREAWMRRPFHNPALAALAVLASRLGARMDGAPAPAPAPPAPPAPAPAATQEVRYVDADVGRLKEKYGSLERAVKVLYRDAHRAREGRRLAEERETKLKAKYEAPGAVVLSADEAKDWDAFRKIGKKPDELTTIVTDFGKLQTRVTTTEREANARKAAKQLQWNEDALARVASREALDISLETETIDGKSVEVPYVQPKEQGAAKMKLADFAKDAKRFDPVYLPALQAKGSSSDASAEATDGARGTPWIEQSPSSEQQKPAAETTKTAGPTFLREKRVLPSQRK